jgi:RNA polymerase sigma-70 factor (ECF subfamily)
MHDRTSYDDFNAQEIKGSDMVKTSAALSRPDELVEGYETERVIQRFIAELDEEHRLVLVLRDIQCVSYEDISAITGLPLGTVKSRLHRARMSLKDKLDPFLRAK